MVVVNVISGVSVFIIWLWSDGCCYYLVFARSVCIFVLWLCCHLVCIVAVHFSLWK